MGLGRIDGIVCGNPSPEPWRDIRVRETRLSLPFHAVFSCVPGAPS